MFRGSPHGGANPLQAEVDRQSRELVEMIFDRDNTEWKLQFAQSVVQDSIRKNWNAYQRLSALESKIL